MFRSLILRLDPLALPNPIGSYCCGESDLFNFNEERIHKFPPSSAPDDRVAGQANWKEARGYGREVASSRN